MIGSATPSLTPKNWFNHYNIYKTVYCRSRNDGLAKCSEQCACIFDPSCDMNTVTYDCSNDWCVNWIDCSTSKSYFENYMTGGNSFHGDPFTRSACLNYCTLAYEYNGDRTAAAAGLSTETPRREQAIEWDRVVAHHRDWRRRIEPQPYVALNPSALPAESIAAGNAVKSEELWARRSRPWIARTRASTWTRTTGASRQAPSARSAGVGPADWR